MYFILNIEYTDTKEKAVNISGARAFLTVVSTKSFSKAAEMLHLTQSTVSFQIKNLEMELGVMLLERRKGHRAIDMTSKGREFLPIAERFAQVWDEAHALKLENTASLVISSVDSLNIYAFSSLYRQLVRGSNHLRLRISTHQTPEIFEQVENRIADIGFVLSQRRYDNIIMQPIFHEPMVWVSADEAIPGSRERRVVNAKSLDFRREILFDWGPEFSQWHSAWCNPNIVPDVQVDTISMLRFFLRDGYWTILPESLAIMFRRERRLSYFSIKNGPPDRVCYKLTHRFPKTSQRRSIEFFEGKLAEYLKNGSVQAVD